MTPVRVALVGCGRMGRAHLSAARDVREVALRAVVDPAPDAAVAATLPCPLLATLDEALELPDLDAVLVAAPTPLHDALTRRALAAGKHVLCEKPLTLDPQADRALGRVAADRGLLLQVGFWRRFSEPYLLLREILAADRIGAVTAIRVAQWDAAPPPPAFCDPATSGGLEVDCGVHEFDLVRWLLGVEVGTVVAASPRAGAALAAVGDVETVFGLARLDGGRTLAIDLTRTAGHRDSIRTEVVAERGSAIVDFADTGTVAVRAGDGMTIRPLAASDVIAAALGAQLAAFAAAVRCGALHADAATPTDSRAALVAARALRDARSASW